MPVVKFYAGLRKVAGTKETSLSASTLQAVLNSILQQYPKLQQEIWDGAGLRPHIIITINGHNIDPESGLNIPLNQEDQIAIFPPIAGG